MGHYDSVYRKVENFVLQTLTNNYYICSTLSDSRPAPPHPEHSPVISQHIPRSDKGIIDLPNRVFGEMLADTGVSLFVFGMKVGTWK